MINKSIDLVTKREPGEFREFRKQAAKIKDLNKEWNRKMKELEEKGYKEKEIENILQEESKLKDLEYMKSQNGPFTKKEEVENYMKGNDSDTEKLDRLYKEVRYAKMTAKALSSKADVFRLRTSRNHYLPLQEYYDNLKLFR